MKTHILSLAVITALFCISIPHTSSAYFTTNQSATKLSETVAMYAIEYAFGLKDKDIYMPIMAERNLMQDSDQKEVGYGLYENGTDLQTQGTTAGLVLSSAPVVNGMYKIEKDNAQKMTLFVIFSTPKNQHEDDYALQITKLPYYVDMGNGELQMQQLNLSELQYYVTKEVELNTGNFN